MACARRPACPSSRPQRIALAAVLLGLSGWLLPESCCGQEAKAAPETPPAAKPAPAVPAKADAAAKNAQSPPAAQPAAPAGPANAAQDLVKKQQEEAAKKKKEEREKKHIPRQQFIAKPLAPRRPSPTFAITKVLPYDEPGNEDRSRFDRMRRGDDPPDPRLIERVAKARVYRMTRPELASSLARERENIVKELASGRSINKGQVDPFIKNYKAALLKFVPDLLDNNMVVRVNALLLANALYDGTADVNRVDICLKVLKDDKQEDAVILLALQGLSRAKAVNVIEVQQEREAVNSILQIAKRSELQELLLEQMVETLGDLRRPHSGDLPERAEIANFLANLALDSGLKVRIRLLAAIALGKLDIKNIGGWNYELDAVVIGKALRDFVDARNDFAGAQVKMWLLSLFDVLKTMRGNLRENDEAFSEFTEAAAPIIVDVWKNQPPAMEGLVGWIGRHDPPKNLKFTPASVPVKFAPAVAKQPNGG